MRRRISDVIGEDIAEGDLDHLQAPAMYTAYLATNRPLHDLLDEAFATGFKPNYYHEALAQLPINSFVTTNWDNLLEEALAAVPLAVPVRTLFRDEHIGSWNETRARNVIKLHGSIQDKSSIVFTEDQYLARYAKDSLLFQLVRVLLASRSVLMLGFSLSDVFVKLLFHQVRDLTARSGRPHWYAIAEDRASRVALDYLRHAGFTPIIIPSSLNDPSPLAPFLDACVEQTATIARDRSTRSALIRRATTALFGYRGPNKIIRIRAMLGPFGNPAPDPDDPIFGSTQRDLEEYELHELCVRLATEAGFTIRLIGSPASVDYVTAKGYVRRQTLRRVRSFLDTAERLGDRFEFAELACPSERNQWIAADQSVIDSWKGSSGDNQLYPDATLSIDQGSVSMAVRWFDDDFAEACNRGGGIRQSRQTVIAELRRLIAEAQ
ncbi:SIR2 family NAD-dependent protein deacylase [Plantactinospora sp. WMMB782]|uniref:SIR2 family NAD-dependent protein deacylase n=1 Tax=Plantactinospora sp. WMMB782 TaxID=3404121 RepID=UPI003B9256DE